MLETWEDIIWFGKYEGKTVKDVYLEDVKYLDWLIENTDKTDFPTHILDKIEERRMESIDYDQYDDIGWGDFHT